MSLADPQTYRWTLDRYLDVAESGVLSNEKVELIDGEIIDMPAQHEPHALAIARTIRALKELFPRAVLREKPVHLSPCRAGPHPSPT